jgi:FkbM family methyltransferase
VAVEGALHCAEEAGEIRLRGRKVKRARTHDPAPPGWKPPAASAKPGATAVGPLMPKPLFESPLLRLKACRHGPVLYLKHDFIGRHFDLYGEFAEFEMALLGRIVQPGWMVADVGANIGSHTVFMAKAAGPTGMVLSFEPQRMIHQVLCGNLALNGLQTVRPVHAAVGAAMGTIAVPAPDYSREGNFGALSLAEGGAGEETPMLTLDSLRLSACNLIKIDVEGMELAVLQGAAETIARCAPVLYLENNRRLASPAILRWLAQAGYRAWWHAAPYFNPGNFFGAKTDVFGGMIEANVLALPASLGVGVEGLPPVASPDDWWLDAL